MAQIAWYPSQECIMTAGYQADRPPGSRLATVFTRACYRSWVHTRQTVFRLPVMFTEVLLWQLEIIVRTWFQTNRDIPKSVWLLNCKGNYNEYLKYYDELDQSIKLWSQKNPLLGKNVQTNTRSIIQEQCFLCVSHRDRC
jgi:hypothetical protein